MICKHCNNPILGGEQSTTYVRVIYPDNSQELYHTAWYQPCWCKARGIERPLLNYFMLRERVL